MTETNKLHGILSAVGILAWSVFILGCVSGSVAWSPDASKIAFAYHDPVAKQDGVMVYDRARTSLVPAYIASGSNEDGPFIQTQWDQTGSRLLLAVYQKDKEKVEHFDFLALSANSARHFNLSLEVPQLPLPQQGAKIFLSSNKLLVLNLDTGEMQTDDRLGKVTLFQAKGRILYSREAVDNTVVPSKSIGAEFGVFDPDTHALHPSFTLLDEELAARGITSLDDMTLCATGLDIAIVGHQKQGQAVIVLLNNQGIDRIVTPQLPVQQPFKMGALARGENGNIYAAVAIRVDDDVAQYAIAEIPPEGGNVRLIPIVRANWNIESSDFGGNFQVMEKIALSPDGRTLATSTAALEETQITLDNRALFLIDLTDRNRRVTKIPISAINRARQ